MGRFGNLDQSALLDALAQFTSRYTKMIVEGVPREVSMACREIIQLLLAEIESRKRSLYNHSLTNIDITLSQE